jgi:hypothetical protein
MTDRVRRGRGLLSVPWLWPFLLLAALALGVVLDGVVGRDRLQLANPDTARVAEAQAALDALPDAALVLVAMDPDLGTYPEIRGTVRALLGDLLGRGARLAMVSFTPEGRAVAAAELERLTEAGADPERLLDLGFVAGAEAGLVLSVTNLRPAADTTPAAFAGVTGGIAAFDMALVVGGADIGPRSWVEQVEPRVPELPIVAVVPTFLHPEVAPYLRTGQLAALLGTLRDDAAYLRAVAAPAGVRDATSAPGSFPMLVGLLVALGFIGRAVYWHRLGIGARAAAHEPGEEA